MKRVLAAILLVIAFIVETNYAQRQRVSRPPVIRRGHRFDRAGFVLRKNSGVKYLENKRGNYMEITLEKEIIFNPLTGEKLLVLESTEEVFRMGFTIDPHSEIAGEHIHPFQQQTVVVTAGELHCRINGVTSVLRAGDSATIPAGARHYQSNPTSAEARAIEEYRPAGRIHNLFRVLFLLAQEGKTNRKGVPNPLIGAALMAEFKDTARVSSPYLRLLFGALAPVSRLLGYRQTIRNYTERFKTTDERTDLSDSIFESLRARTEKV
jgi:quercetin dioxygenase-like cupin family protein